MEPIEMDDMKSLTNRTDRIVVCYAPKMISTNGIWQHDNPLDFSLPLFIFQLTLIIFTTRAVAFILKPFRQPKVVSEILGGVLLGPSVCGRITKFANVVFPSRSVIVLDTVANLGLIYFLFLVGVELDLNVIKQTGRKPFVIALGSMALPFLIGCSTSFLLDEKAKEMNQGTFALFLGVALSITAFPVLARILAELKLLNTEIGRVAMFAAIINDLCAWVLLAVAIAWAESKHASTAAICVLFSCTAFVLICVFAVRPALEWIIRRTPEGESFSDFHICMIISGVMVCSFITDALGTHSIFGAFVFGLVIPNGPLGTAITEKVEDFVTVLLLPLYFAISGLRTNFRDINAINWGFLFIITLASIAKVAGTFLITLYYKMPFREGLTLGLLMNTKGLIEIIVLNVGRDHKVINDQAFALIVFMSMVMTSMIMPTVVAINKSARHFMPYKHRTIQRLRSDSELRMLACIHTPRNVPTIINLLDASHPTKKSPICMYALHLVELTGRASAMLIIHNSHKSGSTTTNRAQAQSDHIVSAFENYEQHAVGVTIQPLTAISPYSTMHEDICNLAEEKHVTLIIVPFHKQQTVDGGMETINPAFRIVNQNVLANAPCSVGIFIDRGLGSSTGVAVCQISHHIAVLFFGGPDDREALAYANRMAEQPGINLTVLRFIPGNDAVEPTVHSNDDNTLRVITDEREKQFDDDYITDFRMNSVNDKTIVYTEVVVNHSEETMAAIRSIDNIHDLYIVGRGQGSISPLTAGLSDWSECPELGAIGDILASADFAATVSVLVMQQYVGAGLDGDGVETPDSPAQMSNQFNSIQNIKRLSHRGGST